MNEERKCTLHSHDFEWQELVDAGRSIVEGHRTSGDLAQRAQELEKDAGAYWDRFFSCHEARFFKPRNYIAEAFPQLKSEDLGGTTSGPRTLLDVGCGAGSTAVPLLHINPDIRIVCCDFSPKAVECVKELTAFASGRCRAFVADICSPTAFGTELQDATVDLVTLIFVLSAIPPLRVAAALANLLRVLRPGGQLLFRDYGLYDLAQLRQAPGSTLGANYYARADGTLARFFERDELCGWFESAGFVTLDASYATVANTNRKTGVQMKRVWLQATFQKPA